MWKEKKEHFQILRRAQMRAGQQSLVYPVGYCLSVMESWMFFCIKPLLLFMFVSSLSHCCVSLVSWIHYWEHYSISKRFLFFSFSFFLKAMAASEACREFKMLLIVQRSPLQCCAAVSWPFNPASQLCSLDLQHGGWPASRRWLFKGSQSLKLWGQQ